MKRIGVFIACGILGCVPSKLTHPDLTRYFAKAEYIPSKGIGADGWAYARRRRLLKRYLQALHIDFIEKDRVAPTPQNKYRDIVLAVSGKGDKKIMVTLALQAHTSGNPTDEFIKAQHECDTYLFTFLSTLEQRLLRWESIEFTQTETCNRLTAHDGHEK
ncbi:MAG TPA: hypothetical protein PLY93_02715 [Turneriella sp.]|nr:hypothetical protein [Turneriella sp.]